MSVDHKDFAIRLAQEAGTIMLEYFASDKLDTEFKDGDQPVTVADKKINQLVIDAVSETFPTHAVDGEEGKLEKVSDYVWVCDPVDGTIPFSRKIPTAAFSLALVHDGKPVLGVVYDPFHDRMICAEEGGGAFLNGEKIEVNARTITENVVVNVEWWNASIRDVIAPMHQMAKEKNVYNIKIPSIVFASLAVAMGEIEASIFPGGEGKNVDIAALKIIIEEAGGTVTDLDGNEQRYDGDINGAIMSNGVIHDEIVSALRVS